MDDQVKKISFGFSKLAKKTAIVSNNLLKNNQDDVSKVELIDCLEGKSIKLKNPIKEDQGPLIIPLIKQKLEKSSTQQINSLNIEIDGLQNDFQNNITRDCSVLGNEDNEKLNKTDNVNESESEIKQETLDEKAAREILEELKQKDAQDEEKRVFSVPLTSNAPTGEKESSLEDYDNIPVSAFGMAMLRGMGWAPGKGIGKSEKLVTQTLPTPRPKGMGLGADKVIKSVNKKNSDEELKMVKGSYIRVLAGSEKDAYGQIEGFDDESGRLIVKLALKNVSVSLNEFMVQLVDTNEFKKNSKVINVSKYEQYKEDEVKKEPTGKILKDKMHEKTHNTEVVSEKQERETYYDRSKDLKEKTSRSYESKERNFKTKRVESLSSRDTIHNTNKPHRPFDSNGGKSPRSPLRSHKYQSTSSKYSNKTLSSHDNKSRSYSSDSSDSYRNCRTTSTNKMKSSKSKGPLNHRSSRQRSSSCSSTSSDSSGKHSRKRNNKHKKKSSSSKYRSRSRSRSPRKHKHKQKKKYE